MKSLSFYLGISIFWLSLSMLFDGMNTLILPARLLSFIDQAHQASVLGLLSFAGLLGALLVQPVAGAVSDHLRNRMGRKGMLAIGVGLALIFLTLFGISRSLILLGIGYFLIQVSGSIAQAAQQGFIPDLVPATSRGKASGWKAFMDIAGATLGFVLLGRFLGSGKEGWALAVIGLALVVALFLTALLVQEKRLLNLQETNRSSPTITRAFQLDLRKHHSFVWLVASRFLFLLGTYAVGRFLLYFVASRLGLSSGVAAEQAGGLLAGLSLATVVGAPFAGWASDHWGRRPVILFGSLVSAIGAILLIFALNLGQIFAFGVLLSLGSAAFASANWALTADLVPAGESARFFGLANIGTVGAAAVAGLFGLLVDGANSLHPGTGYPALFIASALAFIFSALVLRNVSQPLDLAQPDPVSGLERE